jgi:hypothetical protein
VTPELNEFLDDLHRAYEGDAWHGPPLREVLEGITPQAAMTRVTPQGHTICELVVHLAPGTMSSPGGSPGRRSSCPRGETSPPSPRRPPPPGRRRSPTWISATASCARSSPGSTRRSCGRSSPARNIPSPSCSAGSPSTWPTTPGRSPSSRNWPTADHGPRHRRDRARCAFPANNAHHRLGSPVRPRPRPPAGRGEGRPARRRARLLRVGPRPGSAHLRPRARPGHPLGLGGPGGRHRLLLRQGPPPGRAPCAPTGSRRGSPTSGCGPAGRRARPASTG